MARVFSLSCLEGDMGLVGFVRVFFHNAPCVGLPSRCAVPSKRQAPDDDVNLLLDGPLRPTIGYLARGGSNGASKLPIRPTQATIEGPLTTPHSADATLGWVVRGARDSEETKEGASGVPKVPVASMVPTIELVAEESVGQAEG
ncbi:hypothetical protein B296_00040019 [Ensete ventricosum]|uniref:Uncharacterized protein n=1 Tax=Ensete ventricosum TaxID=4639 RepID=A0A426Z085_ENSVE|nr:hypothetical protein B296_00040019 [Ensete ventricosum]